MKKVFDLDSLLLNLLILLLILVSVLSLVLLRDFIGYAASHAARGGRITELNVYQKFPASIWNGVYGIVIQAPVFNTTWYITAQPSGMSEINPIFTCLEPGRDHELYLTTLNFTQIVWENVTVGTTQMLDDFAGIPYNHTMSSTQTFTHNITIELGDRILSEIPAAYMKQYGNPESTEFPVGILQYEGTLIMVTLINNNYITGYRPDKIFNFEMMVPIPLNTSLLKYNLYTDPFDVCPLGESEETFEPGSLYGWVSENTTGLFLENVLVAIERKIFITGNGGFYNISGLQPGNYYVVAIKEGFINYVGNVTIYEGNATEHNISMHLYEEPLTGTGPGVGTGIGPGQDPAGTRTDIGPGVGPGVGPGIGPFVERPETFGIDHWVSLEMLKKRLRRGNFFTENILIFSFLKETAKIQIKVEGNASEILELSDTKASIDQGQYANISVRGFGVSEGIYKGSIQVSGDFNDTLPVEITVVGEEKLPIETMLVNLEILTKRPLPGQNFRFRVNLQNLLVEDRYDVRLDYFIKGVGIETANITHYIGNDTISLQTSHSQIVEFLIPPEWPKGDYFLIVEANYIDLYSRTITIFELYEPIYQYKVFGVIELWKVILILLILSGIIGLIIYIRKRMEATKRFHAKVEYNLLPKKGPRSLYVGKIAETENDTYIDMDKLTVHTIIAGSTGGGKSISAQVIVEECLLKGVAVIVFDPTAQWSGMLRKCTDEKMLSFYPRFHMTKKDARAFNGNIRAIKNPREKIDLMKYWKPGEIQVITTNTLDPKEMDIFVANTVREVFHSNLQEYRGLRMMMVYDEVHRLLPKFGGSGEGFIQIERACREFRKWGIGVMLVSQVLADFVGQIKANINTEIQMKTRDEGDLQRIETKYGKSYIQELVKAPVGSGMIQNSDWNRGKPYYITFRPIMHSVVRLTDEELEQYNKYNEIVDDLAYQLEQLEQEGKDVFDLKLELKLSLDKIKTGSFNMVEIYLEGLKPRIEKMWKELGKKPKKRTIELVSEEELKASISVAKQESEKVKSEGPVQQGEEKKALGLNDDVPPDKMLKLVNGTLVVKLKALVDEIKALKDDEFKQHVNEDKNDFAIWIREAYGNDKWADMADQIITKEDYVAFLEALDSGKEKQFKPLTARKKLFSSKKQEQPKEEKKEGKPAESREEKPQKEEKEPVAETEPEAKPETKTSSVGELQEEKKEQSFKQEKTETIREQPAEKQEFPGAKISPELVKKSEATEHLKQNLAGKSSQEKIDYLKSYNESNPGNVEAMFTLAAEYHRSNDLTNAEKWYKKTLELKPENPKVLYYLGSVYNSMKKYEEALKIYKKIQSLQPDYPKVKEYIQSIEKIIPTMEK